jgi:hypothetical protein
VCIALPRGVVRDVAYCLLGLSGAIAILAVRLTVGLGLPVWIFLIQPTWSQAR